MGGRIGAAGNREEEQSDDREYDQDGELITELSRKDHFNAPNPEYLFKGTY